MTSGIELDQGDITTLDVECIVNAAKKSLLGGGGVDGAIHHAAGPELLEECRTLGGCRTGEAKLTKGYRLKAAYVIHTVGPKYTSSPDDREMLASCYTNSLDLARARDIRSIAFPAISTGVYGYPVEAACAVAFRAITNWQRANDDYEIRIVLSCFDRSVHEAYRKLMAI